MLININSFRDRIKFIEVHNHHLSTPSGRMVLLTLLARVTDGLPLSASIDNSNEVSEYNIAVLNISQLAMYVLTEQCY